MPIDFASLKVNVARIHPSNPLKPDHQQHMLDEGFSLEHIEYLRSIGLRSIDSDWSRANKAGVYGDDRKLYFPSGLLFVFAPGFGQIRCDNPPIKNGKPVKYLTVFFGDSKNRTVAAWLPKISGKTEVITEGYKDAAAGTLIGGIATGAIAGVSHARKALDRGSKLTILFDSDGWYNPAVFSQLCHAAKHTGGKVQLIPTIPGEPKAGLCEYFKAGYKDWHYRELIDSAMSIPDFLFELPKKWKELTAEQLRKCRRSILSLAAQYLDRSDQDRLLAHLSLLLKTGKRALQKDLNTFARKLDEKRRKDARKAKFQEAEQTAKSLLIPMGRDRDGIAEVPKAGVAAAVLEQKYAETLAWHPNLQKFFRYGAVLDGMWSETPIELVRNLIRSELELSGAENQYDSAYLTSISNMLSYSLAKPDWVQPKDLLPFQNGVLNVKTKEFSQHAPGFRLLYQIPHQYSPTAIACPRIDAWLKQATNDDEQAILVLKSFVKACIEGHASLQKFLHLTGATRSGKGTFTRLISTILGQENVVSSSLLRLATNNFETARYYLKRLVIFEDADRYAGDLALFKNLTGQDEMPCERKNKDAFPFRYGGMVVVTSNQPIFSGDSSIESRAVVIPFDRTVKDKDRIDMGEYLNPEIAAFINECLAIPYEVMKAAIVQKATGSAQMQDKAWEYRLRVDPVISWMDSLLVFDPGAESIMGADKADIHALYGSYCQHCEKTGSKPKSLNQFSPYFDEVVGSFNLGIERKRTRSGRLVVNVRLRMSGEDSQSIIEHVRAKEKASATEPTTEPTTELESIAAKAESMPDAIANPPNPDIVTTQVAVQPSPQACELLDEALGMTADEFAVIIAESGPPERQEWIEIAEAGVGRDRALEIRQLVEQIPLKELRT